MPVAPLTTKRRGVIPACAARSAASVECRYRSMRSSLCRITGALKNDPAAPERRLTGDAVAHDRPAGHHPRSSRARAPSSRRDPIPGRRRSGCPPPRRGAPRPSATGTGPTFTSRTTRAPFSMPPVRSRSRTFSHGGVRRSNAPGRVCHCHTSSTGLSIRVVRSTIRRLGMVPVPHRRAAGFRASEPAIGIVRRRDRLTLRSVGSMLTPHQRRRPSPPPLPPRSGRRRTPRSSTT